MNRTQRVAALKQVIAHTIKGERELAEALFKEVTTASAREILGEGNYSLDDDPEFDGRREMQRELEDDLESGSMEPGADELGGAEGPCPECGSEEGCECEGGEGLGVGGDADQTIEDIVTKLEAGNVDDEILSMILAMVSPEEGDEGTGEPELPTEPTDGEPGPEGEEGSSSVGPDGEIDLGALMKSESVGDAADLLKKIKFALEYDYDQFLDSGGEQAEWPQVALGNPSPELADLLLQIPDAQKNAYDSMIQKIVAFQAGQSQL